MDGPGFVESLYLALDTRVRALETAIFWRGIAEQLINRRAPMSTFEFPKAKP